MSYNGRECWLCGANGTRDPLDKHHIFGGALRDKSEKYGATVYLCHSKCHENGPKAAHRCRETRQKLQAYGQRKVMLEQGWTVDEFRLEFGKNHLDEEELAEIAAELAGETIPQSADTDSSLYTREPLAERRAGVVAASGKSAFRVLPAAPLPF